MAGVPLRSGRPAGVPAVLRAGLALAAEAAPAPQVAGALAGSDPLRLDLPPIPGGRVAPDVVRALGALYLAARLDEIGILRAAEWLVRERAVLRVPSPTAARLEQLARARVGELAPDQRALLFARLFGLGAGVAAGSASAGARFEPLLAALCSALVACGERPAGSFDAAHAAVVLAARDLAAGAGAAAGGSAVLVVSRLNDQLRRAIGLLSDPGVGALAGARGLWGTLRALLGPGAPDVRRLLDCGRHGQRVLRWLADAIPALEGATGAAPAIPADAVTSAAAWLQACGLPLPARREGWA